ncbi:MAG: Tic22 family protein [cyanobacterium endosymbiont of Rhopalodia musculus]|uniref:Tic22 family protein n=1 Tax=cyanobacterium endosymbiont of Epithemia clementina EcSB TaxID=3034674 RepID=UPI002481835B|nr:Tic22 family protein [cyanobacterium endosymbiont of Epithemia clementina EcSB]WGT67598.1 hypothetical protein P3F56_00340 [cyanobacterium endosymbiont of Epithemia clementina EcSB]
MKSFIRSSVILGLVGSSVLISSLLDSSLNVLALTPKQIVEKLNQIPVFTIGNSNEILLSTEDDRRAFVTYLSHQDAQQVVKEITKENPETKVEVITIPLGQVYELLKNKEKSQSQEPPDLFTFVPLKAQLKSALSILREEDPNIESFPGIPLFYGMVKVDKQDTFLSVQDGKESFTPFYFERESLQKLIENIRLKQPEFASSIKVKVTPLGGIVSAFESDDKKKEDFVKSVILVPSQESAKKVLETSKQNQQAK